MGRTLPTDEQLSRYDDASSLIESRPLRKVPQASVPLDTGAWIVPVQLTSTTPSSGRYPAVVMTYDPVAKTYTSTGNAVWVVEINFGTLTSTTTVYQGRLTGMVSGVPVFEVSGPAAGGAKSVIAYPSGTTTVVANTAVSPTWNTTAFDNSGGWFAAGSGLGIFTPPAGEYLLTLNLSGTTNVAGYVAVQVNQSGGTLQACQASTSTGTIFVTANAFYLSCSGLFVADGTHGFGLQFFSTQNGTISSGASNCLFTITQIS